MSASNQYSTCLPIEDDTGNNVIATPQASNKTFLISQNQSKNPFQFELSKLVDDPPKASDTTIERSETGASCSCRNYLGLFWSLGSGFVFTIGGVIVKYMKDFHPMTLAIFRFQGILLPALALALFAHYVKKEPVFNTVWPLTKNKNLIRVLFTLLRGVLGGAALILLFYSIRHMPVADALVISSCKPVFVTFVAHVFLGEPCGIFPVFAALMSMVGVGVIARPPMLTGEESFDKNTLMGVAYSFVGMLTAACSMVIIRHLRDLHVSMVTLTFGIWGTIISALGCVVVQQFDIPSTGEHVALAVSLAAVTFIAQTGITMAFKYEQAGFVAILRSADPIFAFLLQFILLGTVPDKYSLLGAALIVICVLLIAFRKWVSTLPEKHPARKTYWFVLK